jgi:DNA-binding transcriptional LysR family regulator
LLINDVLESKLDFAFIAAVSEQRDFRLNYIPLADDLRLVFYASPTNPIFKKAKLEWRDLTRYPLITRSQNSLVSQFVNNKLKSEGCNTTIFGPQIMNDSELSQKLILDGTYIGATWEKLIEEHLAQGRLRVIPLPGNIPIEASLVFYENRGISQIIKKLIPACREAFTHFSNGYKALQ